MKIIDILGGGKRTVSFEFFPPRTDAGFEELFKTIAALKPIEPDYVSVTYGAGGGTRRKTVDLVLRIKHEIGLESMAPSDVCERDARRDQGYARQSEPGRHGERARVAGRSSEGAGKVCPDRRRIRARR